MLTPGQSANFNISFTPTAGSTSSGKVSVISNTYDSTLSVPLTGAGASTGILSANPTSNSFGSIQVGTSASQYQSVTNSGGSNVTVNQANVSGAGFSISGLTLPITLTPGQSYTFNTVFAPASSGAASGSIAVVSDASNSQFDNCAFGHGNCVRPVAVVANYIGLRQHHCGPKQEPDSRVERKRLERDSFFGEHK
jgi:hypothetical protein